MVRSYRYLFYKLYRMETALGDQIPAFTAFWFMVVLQALNVGLLLVLMEAITGIRFMQHLSKIEPLLLAMLIAVPQYFVLVHRGRFANILEEFADEPLQDRKRGTMCVTIYVVLSFVMFVACAVVVGRARYG